MGLLAFTLSAIIISLNIILLLIIIYKLPATARPHKSIDHTRSYYTTCTGRSTDQSALLASDSAREEEDNESLEMESRARQLGWRITKL